MAAFGPAPTSMKYRFLGDSGLLVSTFSFGNWVTTEKTDPAAVDNAYEIMAHGYKHGVNFWDTAEGYGAGTAEEVLGQVLQRGIDNKIWARDDIVISTKIYVGTKEGPNARGLSRKHIVEGLQASLQRMKIKYTDVVFCHRFEERVPIEEIVRAMNFVINQGWAFYWGTSEWQTSDILKACEIADRLGLIRPVCEQPQYNLFERSKVEVDFQPLYNKYGLGLTTWSPLAFGILTGKYANGIPEGSRLAIDYIAGLVPDLHDRVAKVEKLRPIAEDLGCSLAQLALAWCASNEQVSTVILGASNVKQLDENLKALAIVDKITPEIKSRIDAVIQHQYKPATRDRWYTIRAKYYSK
ncbi:hypothetical protein P43SY_006937 [Pythium insidiosum]|uniref:NADP-dependent oxidoreductase domain-containing protein n=1 Tax=Pythium insidiosum TaxID=114742 RepID=A0AAD5M5L6_PYTIN|nr:hypothetical protein P43SY_006937 [Pythium insidiosum]